MVIIKYTIQKNRHHRLNLDRKRRQAFAMVSLSRLPSTSFILITREVKSCERLHWHVIEKRRIYDIPVIIFHWAVLFFLSILLFS